jgi:hypothetical protein
MDPIFEEEGPRARLAWISTPYDSPNSIFVK